MIWAALLAIATVVAVVARVVLAGPGSADGGDPTLALDVRDLSLTFDTSRAPVDAVTGVPPKG